MNISDVLPYQQDFYGWIQWQAQKINKHQMSDYD